MLATVTKRVEVLHMNEKVMAIRSTHYRRALRFKVLAVWDGLAITRPMLYQHAAQLNASSLCASVCVRKELVPLARCHMTLSQIKCLPSSLQYVIPQYLAVILS